MGGGHVDGAGKVIQFKEAVNKTQVDIANNTTATILTLNFTPKFSDSLILCQAFHSHDRSVGTTSYATCVIYAGTAVAARASGVGANITKIVGALFHPVYSGTTPSWGTTSKAIDLRVSAGGVGGWAVSYQNYETKLLVWEIAQ